MKISYGWPEGQTNPAFRDRLISLDSKKPCIMIGRNGSGKTLAAKILQYGRNFFFETHTSFQENSERLKQIGLDWIELEFVIPLVNVNTDTYCSEMRVNGPIAWDLVEDDVQDVWMTSVGYGSFPGFWEVDYHSFTTDLILRARVCNIQSEMSLQVRYHVESRGLLEVINDDDDGEIFDFIDQDWHRGFSSMTRSEIQHIESKFPVLQQETTPESNPYSLWVKLMVSFISSSGDGVVNSLRGIYQRQLNYICNDLNEKCIASGIGNPEIGEEHDAEISVPNKFDSTVHDIIINSFEREFPELVFSDVGRRAPNLERWKKDVIQELVILRKEISKILEMEEYGIGLSMLLEILAEFDELQPIVPKLPDASHSSESLNNLLNEHREYKEQLLSKFRHVEPWLKLIPLYVQRRIPELRALKRLANESQEFGHELLVYKNKLDFMSEILSTIDECFPNFEEFKNSENKYEILIDSISKFQNSGNMESMYFEGINGILNSKDPPDLLSRLRNLQEEARRRLNRAPKQEDSYSDEQIRELTYLVPRFMILFWYSFEMDKDIIALYETYVRMFHDDTQSSASEGFTGNSWSEFLHIIENAESLPSGFKHLLSLVMGITNSDERCIFFIDEPEISLHIDWQRKLIEHLRFLLDESREESMLLIATHSPDIILSHLDDVIDFSVQLNI